MEKRCVDQFTLLLLFSEDVQCHQNKPNKFLFFVMEDLDIFIYTPHLQKHLKSVSGTVKLLLLSDKNNKTVENISICKSVVGGGG